MNPLTLLMLVFALVGLADRLLGNRLGLGEPFEKGFMLMGTMALTMIGMIVLAPAAAVWLRPLFDLWSTIPGQDASVLPSLLFANDMGGAALAAEVSGNEGLRSLNGLVVASMMGCTVSFTIPLAMTVLEKQTRPAFFLGTLCGIVTIPVGCVVSGLMLGLPLLGVVLNLLPLFLFAGLVAAGLKWAPDFSIRAFGVLGAGIRVLTAVGLGIGLVKAVTRLPLLDVFGSLEEAGLIVLDIAVVLAGAFPLMTLVTRLLRPALNRIGKRLSIGSEGTAGILATLVSNVPALEGMNAMGHRAVVLNAAFGVSAAFLFSDHLAFTTAFDPACIPAVLVGKLISGVAGLLLAILITGKNKQ